MTIPHNVASIWEVIRRLYHRPTHESEQWVYYTVNIQGHAVGYLALSVSVSEQVSCTGKSAKDKLQIEL